MNSLPASLAKPLVTAFGRAVRWALGHPWAANPITWLGGFIVLLVGLATALHLGAPWYVSAGAAALLIVPLAALYGWRRLTAPGERPVIFLSQLRPATPGALEASLNHQHALQRRLENGEVGSHMTVRLVPAALREIEAERLLDVSGAQGIVCGEVRASGTAGTFSAVLLQGDAHSPDSRPIADRVDENQREGKSAARHEFPVDYRRPLEELIGERYEADHIDGLEGTVLVTLAERALQWGDRNVARACVKAASDVREHLDLRTRAHLEMARVVGDHEEISSAMIGELEAAGHRDVGHPDLWAFTATAALVGYSQGQVAVRDFLRVAKELQRVAPDDPYAIYVGGHAQEAAGRPGRALNAFERVVNLPEFHDDFDLQMRVGVLAYNVGRVAVAEAAYRRAVGLNATARGHLYLADALMRQHKWDEARAHYRRALLLQPDLVDASRGFWFTLREEEASNLVGPWFDRWYGLINRIPRRIGGGLRRRLLLTLLWRHYRRHPEDSRVHFMIGAHSLLAGGLETAEQRLTFAYELVGGADTEALARLAIVSAQRGDYQQTRDRLQKLHDIPDPDTGTAPSTAVLEGRFHDLMSPLLDEPRLTLGEPGERLFKMVMDVFDDTVPDDLKQALAQLEQL